MREHQTHQDVIGVSFKTFLIRMIVVLVLGTYLSILVYGENSITVLNQLKIKKHRLLEEKSTIKIENQRLQKEYFELKQLEPKEQ
jgi:hypothetical protein